MAVSVTGGTRCGAKNGSGSLRGCMGQSRKSCFKGREQILKVHARNKPMAQDVNFKTLARITAGFSGADLANLLNEAAILAARILAVSDSEMLSRLKDYTVEMKEAVQAKDARLQETGYEAY